jgi:WbqC-like protein
MMDRPKGCVNRSASMKVGMIQSSYLPWRGYFDFIDDVDLFVFYDDVQYTPRSWRNRNRIKTASGPRWITVPVLHERATKIDEARLVDDQRWAEKHVRAITLAYQRAPHFTRYAEPLFAILRGGHATISELNVALVRWVMGELGIRTELRRSGDLALPDDRDADKLERPLRILTRLGATAYLAGPTAKPYTDRERFRAAGVALEFKSYDYPDYPQLHGPFEPQVSVIDLLFQCGAESRALWKSRTPNERVV